MNKLMRKRLPPICFLLLAFVYDANSRAEDEFDYELIMKISDSEPAAMPRRDIAIRLGKNPTISFADVAYRASVCTDDQDYECIQSSTFSFAVPKILFAQRDAWSFGGIKYQMTQYLENYKLLGRDLGNVYVFKSDKSDTPYDAKLPGQARYVVFYFSSQAGLVAMTTSSAPGGTGKGMYNIYVLRGQCGFAAGPTCK